MSVVYAPRIGRPVGAAVLPRVMWLNADRVVYMGLLGEPSMRCIGAFSCYISPTGAHRIRLDGGGWQDGMLSVVPPYVRHCVASDERTIAVVLIEPDTVEIAALPGCIGDGRGVVDAPGALLRMRSALESLGPCGGHYDGTATFDTSFFGAPLGPSRLDPRVKVVIDLIKADPNVLLSAQECAGPACLSVSRFLHLFRAEAGSPFRSFRAWQRARSLLHHVTYRGSLTDIALETGYPDSTHFSHSIRQIYGLTPRSIFEGSRRLSLTCAT